MITLKELISDSDLVSAAPEHVENLKDLLNRINTIRLAWGKPMIVTSGYRSMEKHLAVYAKKGVTDKSKIPMGSNHLKGRALDISDPNKDLQNWLMVNVELLEQAGLWCEDFSATPNWIHFQSVPPKSGKRFFKP